MEREYILTPEELRTPVKELIGRRARELYKEETGKEWDKEPPEEEVAKAYVRRAARQILGRWHRAAKEYFKAVETIFGAPPERRMLLVRINKKTKLIPTEEIVKPGVVPPHATLQCPYCGAVAMKMIVPGLWQCKNCYRTVSIYKWFPTRPRRRRR